MSSQYIYTMYKLSRTHPPDKTVLKDISLSFYPGAKIGVLGLNGTGKSTLLRIMAGIDKDYRGEAQLAPGATVGFLEQEPHLDESKDVRGNVEDGVRPLRDLLDRFNELSMNYSDETADEFARLQDQIDAAGAWELDQMLDQAMDALRCPPGDSPVGAAVRRRAAPRGVGPAAAVAARSAAAGRAHEPPRRRVASRGSSSTSRTTRARSWPSPTIATSSTTSRAGSSSSTAAWAIPSRATTPRWLEQKEKRLAQEEKVESARQRTIKEELEWVRKNPKGRRTKSQARLNRYEALIAEERNTKLEDVQIHIPAGQRLGGTVIEAKGVRKGFGDRLLIEDLSFTLPPAGIVGIIGPNGAGKTTLFKMITGDEQPDSGSLKLGDTVDLAYVDQSRDALDPNKTVWEEISEGYDSLKVGDREMNSRAYVLGLQLQGLRPAAQGRRAVRRRAQPRAPREGPAPRRQRPAARTSPPTTSTSTPCARWKRRCWPSRAAR